MFWMCVEHESKVHLYNVWFLSFAVKEAGDVSEEDIPSIDCNQHCQLSSAPWGSLELVRAFEKRSFHLVHTLIPTRILSLSYLLCVKEVGTDSAKTSR